MSIRTANILEEHQIQLTGLPLRCSACFNQDPSRRHIDMDASCDRGYGNDEAVKVAYDDLVLCENCVKEAAALLNLTEKDDALIQRLESEAEHERRKRKQAENYAKRMEEALAQRPEKIKIDHRQKPRPLRVGDSVG